MYKPYPTFSTFLSLLVFVPVGCKGEHLVEIEGMGFPRARAYRALALSGATTVEGAVNWLVEHSEDADIDEPPPKIRKADAEAKLAKANKPKLTPEEAKEQAAKILAEAKKRREKEEKEQAKARAIAMVRGRA